MQKTQKNINLLKYVCVLIHPTLSWPFLIAAKGCKNKYDCKSAHQCKKDMTVQLGRLQKLLDPDSPNSDLGTIWRVRYWLTIWWYFCWSTLTSSLVPKWSTSTFPQCCFYVSTKIWLFSYFLRLLGLDVGSKCGQEGEKMCSSNMEDKNTRRTAHCKYNLRSVPSIFPAWLWG